MLKKWLAGILLIMLAGYTDGIYIKHTAKKKSEFKWGNKHLIFL